MVELISTDKKKNKNYIFLDTQIRRLKDLFDHHKVLIFYIIFFHHQSNIVNKDLIAKAGAANSFNTFVVLPKILLFTPITSPSKRSDIKEFIFASGLKDINLFPYFRH